MGTIESNTPYDDVCRTLMVECDDLVIPLINELFHENYSLEDRVVRGANEHFLEQQGGAEEKRVTDSLLEIVNNITQKGKKYHLECESSSSDGTILIRIFEYAAQIALEAGTVEGEKLTVEFPHSAILYLRSQKQASKQMEIIVKTPGGKIAYDIPALHVRDYTMDAIFEKRLYFLIPFFIFTMEKELSAIDSSLARLNAFEDFYADIVHKLEGAVLEKGLTGFSYMEIRDMTNRVAQNLARNYENIKERIGGIMGGKVIVTEVSKARRKGREEMAVEMVENMLEAGMAPEEISKVCKLALSDIVIVQERMLQKADSLVSI